MSKQLSDPDETEEWQARGYFAQLNQADCPKCLCFGPHKRISDEDFECFECHEHFDPMRWEGGDDPDARSELARLRDERRWRSIEVE